MQVYQFNMNPGGRYGTITCKSGNNSLEIGWEMSMFPQFDLSLAHLELQEWHDPKGEKIPRETQLDILYALRGWLQQQKIKTDIELPENVETEDRKCIWVDCHEKKLKDCVFCLKHYDENLLGQ
jgi:hypothetical protein